MAKKALPSCFQQATMASMLDWNQCSAVERGPGKVSGACVDDFLKWFPGVTHQQTLTVLAHAEQSLVET
jgi:hypothetical protein